MSDDGFEKGQERSAGEFQPALARDYTDGRARWEWKSYYPPEARREINLEAFVLGLILLVTFLAAGLCLGVREDDGNFIQIGQLQVHISFRLLSVFLTGCVGGATFSIKWLMHSVAKGKWHLDRRYWRFLVPVIGGVYACAVMTLFRSGLFAAQPVAGTSDLAGAAALAFLVGYFSDGVSGLLSNVANAVFGTHEKK